MTRQPSVEFGDYCVSFVVSGSAGTTVTVPLIRPTPPRARGHRPAGLVPNMEQEIWTQ